MNRANGTPLHEASAIAESLKVKTLIKSGCVAKRNLLKIDEFLIIGELLDIKELDFHKN